MIPVDGPSGRLKVNWRTCTARADGAAEVPSLQSRSQTQRRRRRRRSQKRRVVMAHLLGRSGEAERRSSRRAEWQSCARTSRRGPGLEHGGLGTAWIPSARRAARRAFYNHALRMAAAERVAEHVRRRQDGWSRAGLQNRQRGPRGREPRRSSHPDSSEGRGFWAPWRGLRRRAAEAQAREAQADEEARTASGGVGVEGGGRWSRRGGKGRRGRRRRPWR